MSSKLPEFAIETVGLRKTYRGSGRRPPLEALKNIDLAIPRGSIFQDSTKPGFSRPMAG